MYRVVKGYYVFYEVFFRELYRTSYRVFYKVFYVVYRWYYRKYFLRCCIGCRVLNKVYIYVHIKLPPFPAHSGFTMTWFRIRSQEPPLLQEQVRLSPRAAACTRCQRTAWQPQPIARRLVRDIAHRAPSALGNNMLTLWPEGQGRI